MRFGWGGIRADGCFSRQPGYPVEHPFYVIHVGCQFVFIRVDGCGLYSGVCRCRLAVYISVSRWEVFLMIIKSRILMQPFSSCVG